MSGKDIRMQKAIKFIKKNWLLLGFGILIGGILINDVLAQFVWKTGMAFRPNSMYVFLIYIVVFVVAPIGLIEYIFADKYKDIELEEYKDKCETTKDVGRIILSGIGKFVLVIGVVFGMIWVVGTMQSKMLETVIDTSKPYIFISDFSMLPFATGLGMLVLFVWMFSKKGIVASDLSDGGKTDFFAAGERARLPLKVKCTIASGAVAVFLLSICATMFSYHCVTEEGITYKFLWMDKQYDWEEVSKISNRTIERGAEVEVLEMKDGHIVVVDGAFVEHRAEELKEYIGLK